MAGRYHQQEATPGMNAERRMYMKSEIIFIDDETLTEEEQEAVMNGQAEEQG